MNTYTFSIAIFLAAGAGSLLVAQEEQKKDPDWSRNINNRKLAPLWLHSNRDRVGWIYGRQDLNHLNAALDFYNTNRQKEASKYWVGVQCVPLEKTKVWVGSFGVEVILQGGLLVNSVTKDSPAEEAGLLEKDVIVSFNDKRTDEVDQLIDAIVEAGDSECSVKILRSGEISDVNLTPALRPETEDQEKGNIRSDSSYPDYNRLVQTSAAWSGSFGQLPDDVEMTIVRKGKNDPVISFKRNNQHWKIEKGKTVELPDDIKPYAMYIQQIIKGTAEQGLYHNYYPTAPGQFWNAVAEDGSDSRLDRLSAQIDELQKAVEELKVGNH